MLALVLAAPAAQARYLMSADGPGGVPTYELLGKAYTIEVPDCGHMVPHITEEFDSELGKNVFVFHIHVNQDDDRCGAKDRQRTEIRGGKLAEIVASNGETVYYRWKFRLPPGFQTSASFTHIFQVKSDAGAPVMTLTPRSGNLSIDGIVGVRGTTPLAKFIGVWVVVDLKILYGSAGHIDMTIRRVAGGEVLFSHSGAADTWQGNDSGHDPKFGIYRSLNNRADLRDEQVRFADFCVSKQSAQDCDDGTLPPTDGGAGPAEPDAGSGKVDAGKSAPDADVSEPQPDAGRSPPAMADASAGPQRTDAKPSTQEPPPEGSSDPDMPTPRLAKSSGCSVGRANGAAGGVAAVLGLLAAALVLARRRRR